MKKIYILSISREKSQILSLIIIVFSGKCTWFMNWVGGEIKILSVMEYFEIAPMKFAIRKEEINAPNYLQALSSRLHRSMFMGEICCNTTYCDFFKSVNSSPNKVDHTVDLSSWIIN